MRRRAFIAALGSAGAWRLRRKRSNRRSCRPSGSWRIHGFDPEPGPEAVHFDRKFSKMLAP